MTNQNPRPWQQRCGLWANGQRAEAAKSHGERKRKCVCEAKWGCVCVQEKKCYNVCVLVSVRQNRDVCVRAMCVYGRDRGETDKERRCVCV